MASIGAGAFAEGLTGGFLQGSQIGQAKQNKQLSNLQGFVNVASKIHTGNLNDDLAALEAAGKIWEIDKKMLDFYRKEFTQADGIKRAATSSLQRIMEWANDPNPSETQNEQYKKDASKLALELGGKAYGDTIEGLKKSGFWRLEAQQEEFKTQKVEAEAELSQTKAGQAPAAFAASQSLKQAQTTKVISSTISPEDQLRNKGHKKSEKLYPVTAGAFGSIMSQNEAKQTEFNKYFDLLVDIHGTTKSFGWLSDEARKSVEANRLDTTSGSSLQDAFDAQMNK